MTAGPAGEIVGSRVRARRLEVGISRADLATKAGLHPSHIARMEQGEGNPSVETLLRLGEALEISAAAFLDGLGPQHLPRRQIG